MTVKNVWVKLKKYPKGQRFRRDVAQLGSAPRLGRGGRTFKSCHPDHLKKNLFWQVLFLLSGRSAPITSWHHSRSSNYIRTAESCIRFPKLNSVSLRESLSSRPFRKESVSAGSFFLLFGRSAPITSWHHSRSSNYIRTAESCIRFPKLNFVSLRESLSSRPFRKELT